MKLSDEIIGGYFPGLSIRPITENKIVVHIADRKVLNSFIDTLRSREYLIESIVPKKNSLEDTFISLIQKSEEKGSK